MRKEMEEKIFQSTEVDAILLTSPENMRFVAGFTGEGYVYFSRRQKVVVTDSRYVIAAKNECPGYEIETWTSDGYFVNLSAHLNKDENVKRLGIEDEVMTVSLYHKLEKQLQKNEGKTPKLIPLENKMNQLRQIKTEKEQERIRQAEAIGDRAFTKTIAKIHEGMTEKQVAAWLEFYMKEEGAEGFSFDTIAASGEHSAMPHAIPTDKKLENGDFMENAARERIVYVNGPEGAEQEPKKKPELPEALNEDVKQVAKDFRKLTSDASPMLRNYLKQARLSAGEGNRLLIVLPDAVGAGVVGTEEHKEEIRNLIESKIGKKLDIDVRQVEEGRRFEDSFVDIEKLINMDIVVEDD